MRLHFYSSTILVFVLMLSNAAFAQKVGCGGWHSLVVCNDSTVKCFGENATGQLGNDGIDDSNVPVDPGITDMIAVSAGGDQLEAHSMALKSDGTVWTWGSNLYGGLGNGTTTQSGTPVQVLLASDIVAISCGGWHSTALKDDGTVWCWGWNLEGQVGDGTTTDRVIATQVPGFDDVTAIAAGTYHTLALQSDGTVWAWGDNLYGQVGDGTNNNDILSPVQVSGLSDVVHIASGRFFSLAVKSDGTVWTWGQNLYGQLGNDSMTDSPVPVQVVGLTGVTSAVAATGAFHCMAVKDDNTVWAWGRNTYGNIGDNTLINRDTPVQMIGMSDVAGMAAGTNFSLVYKTDGTLWGCGRNLSGQLGDGTFDQHNVLTLSEGVCSLVPPTIGVEEQPGSIPFYAFPNPSSSGMFSLQFSDNLENYIGGMLEVYDMAGARILQMPSVFKSSDGAMIVDLSNQPNGIFFITLSKDANRISQKLIKQ